MKLVQEGNLNVKLDTHYHDEIGTLVHDFNFMIERINELMQNQYMLGQELKTAELKALQSQINPHFLYNTLEMLGWMAYKHEPKEIQSMTNSLAQYYRLSLNHGDDITSISNELKLVESYLHIQSTRFRNDLSILIDIKDIGDFAIPKITLQPIVENSILHGILEKDNKSGTIKIKGRLKKDNMIELSIEDDGIGMDKAQISKLMNTKREPSNMGNYGLRNIEMRICLYFNIEKAIRIISKPGVGTKVLINFPPKPYNLQAN
jgi:two-component system sensor histidine kinase YesM